MAASDTEKSKDTENEGDAHDSQVLRDELVANEDLTASLSNTGHTKAPAKDWDYALLADCSARRLRVIAKDYPGANSKANKAEFYQHIFDCMMDEQDCQSCPGGNCDPAVHQFKPTDVPPQGWLRGSDGIFTAPLPNPPPPAPPSIPPPITLSYVPPVYAPASLTAITTPGTAYVPPVYAPASLTPGTAPGTANGMFSFCPSSMFSNSFATGTSRTGSPNAGLTRPSNSNDLFVGTIASPYIPGIQQIAPQQRNAAQFVIDGAANTSVVNSLVTGPRPALTTAPLPGPQLSQRQIQDREAARLRRQNELLQEQQLSQAYQQQLDQQYLAQEQADEKAHQEMLAQLRAQRLGATPNAATIPPAAAPLRFVAPTPPASMYQPHGANMAQLSPNTAFMQAPTTNHFSPAAPPTHNPHSPLFGGFPPAQASPGHVASPAQFPFTPEQLQAMIDERVRAMSHSHANPPQHCNPHGNPGSQVCGESGKLKTNKVSNSLMAARFGVFAQPLFEVDGDLESADISKMRKVLTPGYDKVGDSMVLRMSAWPHKMLQNHPGHNATAHMDLTFHQFMNGMVTKIASETPGPRLDHELANKLSFLQFLINMSFNYEHKAMLEVYQAVHMAWQMRTFEWTDPWESINERLKNLRGRYHHNPQSYTYKKGARCPNCSNKSDKNTGGGGGGAGNAGKQQQPSDPYINQVPKVYMKTNNICIMFNSKKGCNEKDSHRTKSGATLLHICAGCFAKDNKHDTHPVHNCGKDPFKSLFHNW